ncbi:11177_t:CDS:2, partial [Racocetra fulgida]
PWEKSPITHLAGVDIKHVYPPVLNKFFKVVLGTYKPKVVIVTTPNAEFNVYFPQLKYGTPEATFRIDDHKFEWTRSEFQK